MTRPTALLRHPLRLSPAGRWIPSRVPLNLDRYPRTSLLSPAGPTKGAQAEEFDTLASEATAVPSLQAVPSPSSRSGARTEAPLAHVADATATPPSSSSTTSGPVAAAAAATANALRPRVLGVELPLKPSPPESDECCMSGCATCVYDLYLEDLEHFHTEAARARSAVLEQLRRRRQATSWMGRPINAGVGAGAGLGESGNDEPSPPPPPEQWSTEVLGPWSDAVRELRQEAASGVGGNEGKAGEDSVLAEREREKEAKARAERELARAREALDPSMRAFLEMEARMKAKQRERDDAATATPAPGALSLSSPPPSSSS